MEEKAKDGKSQRTVKTITKIIVPGKYNQLREKGVSRTIGVR